SPRPSPVPATAWSVASTARFHRSDPPAFCSSSAGYQSARYQCFCLWSSFLLPTLHRLALDDHLHKTFYTLGDFDTKTSSWVKTPSEIRKLGGALYCDRRYNQVFVSHNGAESYYAARAFRGSLRV